MISPRLAKFRREADLWSASTFVLGLIIISPIALVLFGLFREGPKWDHMASTVLGSYLTNTFILIATVSIFSILFAILPAWLVSTCDFSGRRIFEWALVMPLALPTYVAAFVYFQVPDAAIPLLIKIRTQFGP
ncbi:iron ABC transporter permease, partial [bacterium]|nr:iron ABC transporter permease [bacterium]